MRIAIWLAILVVVSGLVYLNQVGLPDFVKRPLLERLRARGLELEFTRLRLSFYRGLLADNVSFGQAREPYSPRLKVAELGLELNARALTRFQLQVDSLSLRNGRFAWPVPDDTRAGRELSVEGIQSELRFLPNDEWALDHFKAQFAGAQIQLRGTLTNASAVAEWKLWQPGQRVSAGQWRQRLVHLADVIQSIHFPAAPDLKLYVYGDARDLQTFSLQLSVSAPGADTPWGTFEQGKLHARVAPAGTNGASNVSLDLEAASAQTPWAATSDLRFVLQAVSTEGQTNLAKADISLKAADARTRWANGKDIVLKSHLATAESSPGMVDCGVDITALHLECNWATGSNTRISAQWAHSLTNPVPISGEGRITCEGAQSPWASGRGIEFHARLDTPPAESAPAIEPDTLWWTNIQPYQLEWDCRVAEAQSTGLVARAISASGRWFTPELVVSNLNVSLYEGALDASALLNVTSGALSASAATDFDPHRVLSVLPRPAREWLSQFTWQAPPLARGQISLVLPAWTNREPDWAGVIPSLVLNGAFHIRSNATYRGLPVSTAQSHFVYSNMCWHLPDLVLTRPEGRLEAEHRADDRTHDFYWRISSTFDPMIIRPLLDTNQPNALDLLALTEPPAVQAEIRGRSREPERTWFKGRVGLTNFTFRGESFGAVQTDVEYTNQVVRFLAPRVQRGGEQMSADGLAADFNAQKIYLTNGFSTADPGVVTRAIGAHIGRAIEPYRFDRPPTVHGYGTIPMHGEEDADLHFAVDGGPFHWSKFNVQRITGEIHWQGLLLKINNVQSEFYGGTAGGYAEFHFKEHEPVEFQFALSATNSSLHPLIIDYFGRTNRLEGTLTGNVVVTHARGDDWQSANGYGQLSLRDGLIWDIPIFGIFSPVLNSIVPGLGSSRASSGTCTFAMTNGVLHTDDLEFRASALRLQYHGAMDLQGGVNARVEAELLRDVWLVGPLVSTVFWPVTKMFEYKVTGTLDDPKTEPVYIIPKLVLLPFQPFRALKGLLPDNPNGNNGSPPPKKP